MRGMEPLVLAVWAEIDVGEQRIRSWSVWNRPVDPPKNLAAVELPAQEGRVAGVLGRGASPGPPCPGGLRRKP